MTHDFNEKTSEYSAKHGERLSVIQSTKYKEAKQKAIEIIESGKFGVVDGDFWILMNTTKDDHMMYSGLIISHNGCLKINDNLDSKFKPSCVFHDTQGFGNSLVFHYANDEQGIYEVGEVSAKNCKNDYPYAMAYKRLFDRVVLKLSKLAYAGIYSDSESDEFTQKLEASDDKEEPKKKPEKETKKAAKEEPPALYCMRCKKGITAEEAKASKSKYKKLLCSDCIKAADEYYAKRDGWEIGENKDK